MPAPFDATLRERLGRLLTDGHAAAAGFASELAREREALEQQDADALNAVAGAKQQRLAALEAVESERRKLLSDGGFSDDLPGMDALLASCDPDGRLGNAWPDYLSLAKDCHAANTTNGAIIRLRQQQLATVLSALSGARPQTYGPDGTDQKLASRSLAEA